jgi:hypothetical protein
VALAWLLVATLLVAWPSSAQGPEPIFARLVLENPPANAVYSTTQPIPIVVEVGINPALTTPLVTTEGFSRTEFWRRLFFTDPQARTVANLGQEADEGSQRTFFCLSRAGVLLRPTSIPVVPVEVLASGAPPAGFFVSYRIDDARKYYDLSRPGRYTVNARVPFQSFTTDMNALIDDCDQLPAETVANVTAVSGRQAFTAISNSLEFVIGSPLRFGGFRKPLVEDVDCRNAAQSPCATLKANRTLWVEFQLFGPDGAPIIAAQPRIVVTKVGGGTATLKDDQFAFHAGQKEYRYLLHTHGLTKGVWRIDVVIDIDGSVHSAHIGLR